MATTRKNQAEKAPDRYVLFTNLKFVQINGVRTYASAMVLEDSDSAFGDGRSFRARGFGVSASLPVFDMQLASVDYRMTSASGGPLFITDSEPEARPLFQGAILAFPDETRIDLITNDHRRPIRVDRFEGPREESVCTQVWDLLEKLVAHFWDAPNMPVANYQPAARVRSILGGVPDPRA